MIETTGAAEKPEPTAVKRAKAHAKKKAAVQKQIRDKTQVAEQGKPQPAATGRPAKYTTWTAAMEAFFKKVMEEGDELSMMFSDQELVEMINWTLDDEEKDGISIHTFKDWKRGKIPHDALQKFSHAYKKATAHFEKTMLKEMRYEQKGWQRYAWLLQKFKPVKYGDKVDHNVTGMIQVTRKVYSSRNASNGSNPTPGQGAQGSKGREPDGASS